MYAPSQMQSFPMTSSPLSSTKTVPLIASKTMPFLRLAHKVHVSLAAKPTSHSTSDLRPCQQAYMGESNARRLLKRSQLSKKTRALNAQDETSIFKEHEAATVDKGSGSSISNSSTIVAPFQVPTQATTGYSVHCYATHAEDAARRKEAAITEKERAVLFASINACRRDNGKHPLRLKPLLSQYAQEYADMLHHKDQTSSIPLAHDAVVVTMLPSGTRMARLVSPPRIGALACAEMWYGGKYKRHLYAASAEDLSLAKHHPLDCPCRLRMVFETMVDKGWTAMGIGRGEDGRWVVELGK